MLCYNELRMKVLRMFVAAPWPSRRSPGILRNILFNIIQTQMPFAKKGSFTPFFSSAGILFGRRTKVSHFFRVPQKFALELGSWQAIGNAYSAFSIRARQPDSKG
jgi:hypothetical protein